MSQAPNHETLAATWARMEPLLDQALDEGENETGFSPFIQKIVTENTSNDNASMIFDQGVSCVAPDMFDLAAGLEPDLDKGELMSRYRIIKPLGSGGMGDVYLAERADGQYEKQVALKILSMGMSSPVLLNRFQREMQILAELHHPGIAALLDAGIAEDGRPWFVLDYIQGIPLTDYCSRYDLHSEATVDVFLKVCLAVSFAHEHGVVHRDLKPENILVEGDTDNPQPVVLDFGIASREQDDDLTCAGNMLGTPSYASPEQAKGDYLALDQRSDIFSLGILLYELIDKRKPFTGGSNTEVSYHIIHEDTPQLTQTGISPDLSAIIFKCLHKTADDRYTSVQMLIEDLQHYQAGKSVSANPVGLMFRMKRRIRRYPVTSSLIFITSLVVIVLGAVSVWQSMSKHDFASQQAEVAQYYGQAAQQIASSANLIYSRPLHNIESEMDSLNRRYQSLERELPLIDPTSQHVAQYALGRAALSLGRIKDAQQYLQQAWNSGLHAPLLALRLGQTYMRLHAKAVQESTLLSSINARKQAFDKAREDYLQPARQFLLIGATSTHEDASIAKAMLSYAEDDTQAALSILQQTIDQAAWPVTAMIAAGNIYLESAERNLFEGNNTSAYELLGQAENLFEQAAKTARSHPGAIKGQCVSRTKMIQSDNYQQVTLDQINIVEPCDALVFLQLTNPAYLIQAGVGYSSTAREMLTHGDDPSATLTKAMDLAQKALAYAPNNPQALHLLGAVQLTETKWVYERGGDADQLITAAISSFENAVNFAPGDRILQFELVQALHQAGRIEYANGGDGDPAYAKINQILQRLIQQPDVPLSTWIQYASTLSWRGYYRYTSGRDAESILRQSVDIAGKALAKAPDNMDALKALAMAAWTYADFHYVKGEDPKSMSTRAISHYQTVIDNDPGNCVARINQLGALTLAVDFALDKQQTQKAELEHMHQLLIELQLRLDDVLEAQLPWADYWRYSAKQTLLENADPGQDLQTARDYLKAALASKIDRYEAVQSLGHVAVFEHNWRQVSGNWKQLLYDQDMMRLTQAIQEYPDLPILRAMRGQLRLLNAKAPELLAAAADDFTAAIDKNPLLSNRFGQYLMQISKMTTE